MPIYEYRCNECGEEFEKFLRSMSASKDLCCPKCGSRSVAKVMSLFGTARSSSGSSSFDSSCAPTGG
jgi:putative FmdB family regulatory protein